MTDPVRQQTKVLIITGISPVTRSQLEEMGMIFEPLALLLSMSGKDTFRFSMPTLGAATIGGYLAQQSIEVKIVDYFFDEVHSFDADIVGISSTLMDIENVRNITVEVNLV